MQRRDILLFYLRLHNKFQTFYAAPQQPTTTIFIVYKLIIYHIQYTDDSICFRTLCTHTTRTHSYTCTRKNTEFVSKSLKYDNGLPSFTYIYTNVIQACDHVSAIIHVLYCCSRLHALSDVWEKSKKYKKIIFLTHTFYLTLYTFS